MSSDMRFETTFGGLSMMLRKVAPEVRKEMAKELRAIAIALRDEVRTKVPSGMQAARTQGVRAGFLAAKGAYVEVGGYKSPASWVGAYDGAGGKTTFSHPVFPESGQPRSMWNWSKQPVKHILEETWEARRETMVARSDVAIRRALTQSGMGSAE